jgi:O-methyltransferase
VLQSIRIHIRSVLAKAGYEIRRTQPVISQIPWVRHSQVYPHATYSPWLADEDFRRTYEIARLHTLVDQYRCYELWALVGETAKLAAGDVIEVGVWRGGTGCLIAKKSQLCGIKAKVHLCDNFEGLVKTSKFDACFSGGELADTSEASVGKLVRKLNLANVQILRGIFPDATGSVLESRLFRFCHIDVAVYRSARDIFAWLWGRVVLGGLVVFDDYGFSDSEGITRLVEEERYKSDRVLIHNLNGHAVIVKIK